MSDFPNGDVKHNSYDDDDGDDDDDVSEKKPWRHLTTTVGCTQEIWFARTTRASSLLLAGDDDDDHNDDDSHMAIWSYGGLRYGRRAKEKFSSVKEIVSAMHYSQDQRNHHHCWWRECGTNKY